jgi:outer membrane protein insertion porin family
VEDFEGGVKLTFVVMERPFVRDVEFTGNSRLNTADLQEKIDLKLGSVYNPVDVERAKEKIKEAYEDEGYFEIQVGSAVEKFGDGDVKVVFTVNEGRRITIEKIVFKGNKGLKDSIIKDAMITKERQLFILRGTVQRQKLEEDIDRIVGVYQDNGYVQMRVERYDTSVNRETARVTRPRCAASFASRPVRSSPAPSCATASGVSAISTAPSAAPRPRSSRAPSSSRPP